MSIKRKIMLSTLLLSTVFCGPAYAGGWTTPPELEAARVQINGVTTATASQTQAVMEQVGVELVAALEQVSQQNTTNTVGQTNAIANMKDVEDQRRVTLEIQKQKLAAVNSATSGASSCNGITGAAATANLETLAKIFRTNVVQAVLAHDQGHLDGSNTIETAYQLRQAYTAGHCQSNASEEDITMGRCQGSTVQKATMTSTDSNGRVTTPDDQNAELFLNNDTLNDSQIQAMERFVALTMDGNAIGQSTIPNNTNAADREKIFYNLDLLRGLRSIAVSTVSGLISEASIIKTADGKPQLQATNWANATAGKMAGRQANSSGTLYPDGVSELAADSIKSEYWYDNIDYRVYATAEGQAQAAKDLNEMMAWNTVMNYKKYLQMRQMNANLAAMLAIMIDERQDKVMAQ